MLAKANRGVKPSEEACRNVSHGGDLTRENDNGGAYQTKMRHIVMTGFAAARQQHAAGPTSIGTRVATAPEQLFFSHKGFEFQYNKSVISSHADFRALYYPAKLTEPGRNAI